MRFTGGNCNEPRHDSRENRNSTANSIEMTMLIAGELT